MEVSVNNVHVCVFVERETHTERLYIVIHYDISVHFEQLNLQQNLTYKYLQDDQGTIT